jgi:vanillate O-demethylase monooxygenase subunit
METKIITMENQKYPKDCWYVAGMSDEFEKEELKNRVIAGSSIVVWRTKEGKVVAFDNRCCHKRFPLSESRLLDNGLLECAYPAIGFVICLGVLRRTGSFFECL